jgi:large subunit ribosomal protein L22
MEETKDKQLDNKMAKVKPEEKKDSKLQLPKNKKDKKVVTEVKASARFIHVAPRKVRLVIDELKGLEAVKALDYLKFVNKAAVRPVTKLINSAVANAENNFQLDKKDLYIKTITVNGGPVLKRWRPRAHGRSAPIRKRTSHIELILGVKAGAKLKAVNQKEAKKPEKSEEVKIVKPEEVKKERPKTLSKGPQEKGKTDKGFFRGIFQRKTG